MNLETIYIKFKKIDKIISLKAVIKTQKKYFNVDISKITSSIQSNQGKIW